MADLRSDHRKEGVFRKVLPKDEEVPQIHLSRSLK